MEILNIKNKIKGCLMCGSKMVWIRGKYPKDPKRKICPCCAQERLEEIESSKNNLTAKSVNPLQKYIDKL